MECLLPITTPTGIQRNVATCCLPQLDVLKSSSRVQNGEEQHHCVACVSILAQMEIRTRTWYSPILTRILKNQLQPILSNQDITTKPSTNHYQIASAANWKRVPPNLR